MQFVQNQDGAESVLRRNVFLTLTNDSESRSLTGKVISVNGDEFIEQIQDVQRQVEELQQGNPFHGEAINYHKDGSEFYVEWNITFELRTVKEVGAEA